MPCPSGKNTYPTRSKARTAAKRRQHDAGHPLDVYRCPEPGCRWYHLTTRRPERRPRRTQSRS